MQLPGAMHVRVGHEEAAAFLGLLGLRNQEHDLASLGALQRSSNQNTPEACTFKALMCLLCPD